MALDIIFGRTRRNWSRGHLASAASPRNLLPAPSGTSDEVTVRLTETEIAMLAEIAATRAKAEAGDRNSRAKMKKLAAKISSLKKKTDPASKRTLLVLRESGIFQDTQTIVLGGEQISNVNYRIAVLRQARRTAGNKTPTTKDFATAKSAVDGTMRQSGISLYLPGSRPGRVTH